MASRYVTTLLPSTFQAPGTAALVAAIDRIDETADWRCLHLRVNEPAPGIAMTGAYACGGMLMATLQVYLFGPNAATAARDQSHWQQWLAGIFPAAAAATGT